MPSRSGFLFHFTESVNIVRHATSIFWFRINRISWGFVNRVLREVKQPETTATIKQKFSHSQTNVTRRTADTLLFMMENFSAWSMKFSCFDRNFFNCFRYSHMQSIQIIIIILESIRNTFRQQTFEFSSIIIMDNWKPFAIFIHWKWDPLIYIYDIFNKLRNYQFVFLWKHVLLNLNEIFNEKIFFIIFNIY